MQARISRDAIAEFEFISNRFDATQGRSSGIQINAVTRGGTNTPSGLVRRLLPRLDKWNAEDPVLHEVLPYSDQQLSVTFGGPIIRDKFHYFVNYEYEREPLTFVWNTPYPAFNLVVHRSPPREQGRRAPGLSVLPLAECVVPRHGVEEVPAGRHRLSAGTDQASVAPDPGHAEQPTMSSSR